MISFSRNLLAIASVGLCVGSLACSGASPDESQEESVDPKLTKLVTQPEVFCFEAVTDGFCSNGDRGPDHVGSGTAGGGGGSSAWVNACQSTCKSGRLGCLGGCAGRASCSTNCNNIFATCTMRCGGN